MQSWEWEYKKGQLWRAKEILRGHIANKYDPKEYLAYGKILYELHDLYEAGKYLFAGGESIDGKYKDAINLFLERNAYKDLNDFLSLFPRQFQKSSFYPESVREFLQERYGEKAKKQITEAISESNNNGGWRAKVEEKIIGFLVTALVLYLFFSLIVGIKETATWVFQKFDGAKAQECQKAWRENCERLFQKCLREQGVSLPKSSD